LVSFTEPRGSFDLTFGLTKEIPPVSAHFRIAVTGASGFIGHHLVPALSSYGHQVTAITRRSVAKFSAEIRQVVIADLTQLPDWVKLLQHVDIVIHLAGIAHATGEVPPAAYDQVNHRATAALAGAAHRLRVRLIFISSIAAQVGPSTDRIVTEIDVPAPTSAYGRSKREAERAIAAVNGHYVILRPTLVYGAGVKANMAKLIQVAKLPLPIPFAAIHNSRSLLGIHNLIQAIEFLVTHEDINKETFLIADPEPISLPEMISYIREGMGRAPNLISMSPTAIAGLFSLAKRSEMWERLSGNLVVSTEHLCQAGFSPVERTSEGLRNLGRYSRTLAVSQ
jgi:nucleoside-diphosphate-sugar epimerase